jgi:uncharacterized delta-60 repeat protein
MIMKINIYAIVIIIVLSIGKIYSQVPNYIWAKQQDGGGTDFDYSHAVTTDPDGNIIVVGNFHSPYIKFGSILLINEGEVNCFIVKYDPNGNVIWAKQQDGGGDGIIYAYNVTTDSDGNIIVAGMFSDSTITFGSTTLTNANPGSFDIFVVKYDSAGNVIWAKQQDGGGDSSERLYGIATDPSGNIIITGYFMSSSITFGNTTLTSVEYDDIFIVKYDPDGNVLWAKQQDNGGNGEDRAYEVATDSEGNIIIVGYFSSSSITFGSTTLTNPDTSGQTYDIFVVKYDANGNVLWANQQDNGGEDNDYACGVTTDSENNVIVVGYFGSSSISFNQTTLTNAGGYDVFIIKYTPYGDIIWAKQQDDNGTYLDYANGVTTDNNDNIIMVGHFINSITFGTTTLVSSGSYDDIFVVKYNSNGNALWAKQQDGGGHVNDYAISTATDSQGNIIVTGNFYSSNLIFGTTSLTNEGYTDPYVVKIGNITSQPQLKLNNNLTISPNPTNKELNIVSKDDHIESVIIMTMEGEKIKSYSNINNYKYKFNISYLTKGCYIIYIKFNNGNIAKAKIIKN